VEEAQINVFSPQVLDIDESELIDRFLSGIKTIAAISLALDLFPPATLVWNPEKPLSSRLLVENLDDGHTMTVVQIFDQEPGRKRFFRVPYQCCRREQVQLLVEDLYDGHSMTVVQIFDQLEEPGRKRFFGVPYQCCRREQVQSKRNSSNGLDTRQEAINKLALINIENLVEDLDDGHTTSMIVVQIFEIHTLLGLL
jgi:hypothetical protein